MKMLNNKGPRINPCDIPQITPPVTEAGTNLCSLFPSTEVISYQM